jgi:ParB family transcriptional regulator, chromosome partitioning protein
MPNNPIATGNPEPIMSKKAALGRGLNALLPNQHEEEAGEEGQQSGGRVYSFEDRVRLAGRVADIDIESIRPNPYQPRREFDEKALDELAASIVQLGIIQPLTVRALGGGRFELISGERRLRASRRAGLKKVPAFVREADTEAMLEMAIVENIQREELNPIEIAVGYQRLIEECSLTQEDVARKVGKNRATIANLLRLLKLPARIQAALKDGSLTIGHARALLPIEDEAVQIALSDEIGRDGLNVRQVEERVKQMLRPSASPAEVPEKNGTPEPETLPERDRLQIEEITSRLRAHLSTQVRVQHKVGGGGRIEIAYYSSDDLERVLDLLGLA